MDRSEDCDLIPTPSPVFVDDSGRRGTLFRLAVRILMVGFTAYLGLLGAGLARDPRLGPLHLPTFGLPSLTLAPPPAPAVLGEQTARPATDTEVAAGGTEASPSGTPPVLTTAGAGTGPAGGTGSAARVPVGTRRAVVTPTTTAPTTTTGAPTDPGQGSKGSTTTTSSTTTPATTPTGQSTTVASGKGPDGSGPPGQERKPTTPTTGRRAAG